jgi:ZIP family zinc transporter
MSIICFDLIPEAFNIANIVVVIIGIIMGIVSMLICDNIVKRKFNTHNNILMTGIIVSIGLAIHNLPEGLAIGSGFESSIKLGLGLAIAICLHDIPEGISMAVPMRNGGINPIKVIFYVVLSGVTTGMGAFFGSLIGGISQNVIAICLSFAAGAMLYIVSGELVPESNELYKGKLPAIGNIIGFVLGMVSIHF